MFPESDEDFEFIDPAVFKEFQSVSFSIEKIKKQIFNTEENGNEVDQIQKFPDDFLN